MVATYEYALGGNGRNYTGYPTYGLGGSDALFESDDNEYQYQSSMTVCGAVITETYNHLHLLTERRVDNASGSSCDLNLPGETGWAAIGAISQVHEYVGGPDFPPYNQLPANYQVPVTTTTTSHSATESGESVTRKRTSQANVYGQVAVAEAYGQGDGGELKLLQQTKNEYDEDNYGLPTKVTTTDGVTGKVRVKTAALTPDGMNIRSVTNGELDADENLVKDKTRTFEQDASGRTTKTTLSWADGESHVGAEEAATSVSYALADGKLTVTTTDAVGNASKEVTDVRNSWQLSKTDGRGNTWSYAYDALGRPTQLTNPDASTVTRTYVAATDPSAKKVEIYSPGTAIPLNSRTTLDEDGYETYEYTDGLRRILRTADNMGQGGTERLIIASQSFNAIGKPSSRTDTLGRKQSFAYDALGQATKAKNSLGEVVEKTYDDAYSGGDTGALNATRKIVTTLNGVTVEHEFQNDRKKPVRAIAFPATATPTEQTLSYDGLANQTQASIQAQALTATRGYGPGGLLLSASVVGDDKITSEVAYTRDLLGKRYQKTIEQTLADGTSYDYEGSKYEGNAIGLVETLTNAADQTLHATYNASGKVATFSDYAGQVFTGAYDALNRLTSVMTPESATTPKWEKQLTYTGRFLTEKKLLVDDAATSTITLGYQKDGKLQSKEYADEKKMTWTRDESGRLQQVTDYAGVVTTYEYSQHTKRLIKVSNPHASLSLAYYDQQSGDFANWSGRLSTLTYGNGVVVAFSYDGPRPRIKTITATSDGTTLASFEYAYDGQGRVSSVDSSGLINGATAPELTKTYAYDSLGHLTSASVSDLDDESTSYAYAYHPAVPDESGPSNITDVTTDAGAGAVSDSYVYNAINQLKTSDEGAFTHDLNGNMTADAAGSAYDYNVVNQLTKFTPAAGEAVSFDYYADGSLKSQTTDSAGATVYYYDESKYRNVVNKTEAGGGLSSYLFLGPKRIARVTSGNDVSYFLWDEKSIRGLVDDSGELLAAWDYLPYGKAVEKTGGAPELSTEFLYNGERYIAAGASGLYDFRARFYSPTLRRFISQDTKALMNRYAFANGDPINHVDPSGQSGIEKHLASIVVAAVLVVGGIVETAIGGKLANNRAVGGGLSFIASGVALAVATFDTNKAQKEALYSAAGALAITGISLTISSVTKGGRAAARDRLAKRRARREARRAPRQVAGLDVIDEAGGEEEDSNSSHASEVRRQKRQDLLHDSTKDLFDIGQRDKNFSSGITSEDTASFGKKTAEFGDGLEFDDQEEQIGMNDQTGPMDEW